MMNLSSTNEEIEALKYFLGDGNKAMNQLLISNCETDIALLSNELGDSSILQSYDREIIIENLMKIKALYTLILKEFYKTTHRNKEVFRGTNLAEVERLKNEPFIDKIISTTKIPENVEKNFDATCNKPTCINIKLDLNVPRLVVKDVLDDDSSDEVIIAPFTKIKSFEMAGEKPINNTSRNMKIYDIELEKQELEELADRERFGVYNYILDNSYLIKFKLEECIKLEQENSINFENIRKLEQLLVKYENSLEENDVADEEDEKINITKDYDDIERINKELTSLKEITTNIFEKRRNNINFINMWKRNIAVYMMAECKEIEKKFEGLELPEIEEENLEVDPEIEKKENIEETEVESTEEFERKEIAITEPVIETTDANTEVEMEQENNEEITEPEEAKVILEENQPEKNDILERVQNESKENVVVAEKLISDIKNLISKQQNHARIAGNIGSVYSALNNAFEMKSMAESLLGLLNQINGKIEELKSDSDNEKLEGISKVNIEISTLMNYLNNPKIALSNSKITRFEEMAIIEENELKRGIAEKIREIRGEAELKKLKDDTEIIEDKNAFDRFIGIFTGQNKLDNFMLDQIEVRKKAIRKNLSKHLNLAYNYSIHELMAEIEMFIDENYDDELIVEDVEKLRNISEELRRNYIISDSKVRSISQKKAGKNLPLNTKKISKYEKIEIETYRFLNKYGYDIELKNNEPKYQDTMSSEIARIVEYIKSSKIY